jgi:hypothetical protein
MAGEGFHEGELAVQTRAGVRAQAARLGGAMLAVPDLNGGISGFLAERHFASTRHRSGSASSRTNRASKSFRRRGCRTSRD